MLNSVVRAGERQKKQGVFLQVHLSPSSSRNGLKEYNDQLIRWAVSVSPVNGQANKALIQQIAAFLNVPNSSVEIVSGEKSRYKSLFVAGVGVEQVSNYLFRAK